MTMPALLIAILAVAIAGVAAFQISSRNSAEETGTTPEGAIGEAMEAKNVLEKNMAQKTSEETDGAMMTKKNEGAMTGGPLVKPESTVTQNEMQKKPDAIEPPTSAGSPYQGTVLAGSPAPLLDFNRADYQQALASDKLVVLYFYATWCPTCKAEVTDGLYPAFNALQNPNVVGFRVNYNDSDTDADEQALARQFGVGYQHTKVFLKNGQRILKAPDSWNKDRYLSEIAANS